ncbi:YHS domain-containing protein [Marinicella rhabdoformis]|uniref:YHS domain-containing protein n=1 Tax=Marinicella rhabdoformis TaxID=2580566 RepID=UPI0012AED3D0|nr:YHS domain-containing protein [Marinicella rhabdoformis]
MQAINKYCPRSGKEIAADSLVSYRGHTAGFCNPGCSGDFAEQTKNNPEACPKDRAYFDVLIKENS